MALSQIGVDVSFGGAEPMAGSVDDISGRVVWLSILNTKFRINGAPEIGAGAAVTIKFRSDRFDECPMLRGIVVGGSRTTSLTFVAVEVLDWQKLAMYWQACEHRAARRAVLRGSPRKAHRGLSGPEAPRGR